MKRFWLLLPLLLLCAIPSHAACINSTFGSFSAVNCAQPGTNAGAGQTFSAPAFTITAGHLVVVYVNLCNDASCATPNGITVSSVTSTNNTWTSLTQNQATSSSGQVAAIFYTYNAVGGSDTITAHASSASAFYLGIQAITDFSGAMSTANPGDQSGAGFSNSSNTATITTMGSAAFANELVYAINIYNGNANGNSVSAGYSVVNYASNTANKLDVAEAMTAPGIYSATFTVAGGGGANWALVIATFKPPTPSAPAAFGSASTVQF